MSRLEYADVPVDILAAVQARAMALPEVLEEPSWAGRRWRIRKRTFAHVVTVVGERGENTFLTFRSAGEELDVLHTIGHPFFRPGWGTNVVGMVLDQDRTDWDEVGELLTDSYCVMAPKKLAAQVRPE